MECPLTRGGYRRLKTCLTSPQDLLPQVADANLSGSALDTAPLMLWLVHAATQPLSSNTLGTHTHQASECPSGVLVTVLQSQNTGAGFQA